MQRPTFEGWILLYHARIRLMKTEREPNLGRALRLLWAVQDGSYEPNCGNDRSIRDQDLEQETQVHAAPC